jgi:hypothetical protein
MEITSIASFLDYFDKIRERTMRVITCIPPEKIEWRAAEGKFLAVPRHLRPPRSTQSDFSAHNGFHSYPQLLH